MPAGGQERSAEVKYSLSPGFRKAHENQNRFGQKDSRSGFDPFSWNRGILYLERLADFGAKGVALSLAAASTEGDDGDSTGVLVPRFRSGEVGPLRHLVR